MGVEQTDVQKDLENHKAHLVLEPVYDAVRETVYLVTDDVEYLGYAINNLSMGSTHEQR
jgi:hypothetical protein